MSRTLPGPIASSISLTNTRSRSCETEPSVTTRNHATIPRNALLRSDRHDAGTVDAFLLHGIYLRPRRMVALDHHRPFLGCGRRRPDTSRPLRASCSSTREAARISRPQTTGAAAPCRPGRAPSPTRRCGIKTAPPRGRPQRRPRPPSRSGSPGPRSPARPLRPHGRGRAAGRGARPDLRAVAEAATGSRRGWRCPRRARRPGRRTVLRPAGSRRRAARPAAARPGSPRRSRCPGCPAP